MKRPNGLCLNLILIASGTPALNVAGLTRVSELPAGRPAAVFG
jgi:hypothetical protein